MPYAKLQKINFDNLKLLRTVIKCQRKSVEQIFALIYLWDGFNETHTWHVKLHAKMVHCFNIALLLLSKSFQSHDASISFSVEF